MKNNQPLYNFILISAITLFAFGCTVDSNLEGKRLYDLKCLNCHQEKGQGVGTLIPGIDDQTYLSENRDKLACIINYGLKGEIHVNSKTYGEKMPATKGLKEADLVNLLNFIGENFGNNLEEFTLEEVKSNLDDCSN